MDDVTDSNCQWYMDVYGVYTFKVRDLEDDNCLVSTVSACPAEYRVRGWGADDDDECNAELQGSLQALLPDD